MTADSLQSSPPTSETADPRTSAPSFANLKVAVVVPCYNEEVTIGEVIRDFRQALPDCSVYVYDNNSTDKTAEVARAAGAIVRTERRQGKGHVVRRMFANVSADIYVMVDGDATYEAAAAPRLIEELLAGEHDMIVGARRHQEAAAYRPGHQFGNLVLTGLVAKIFNTDLDDMLSGYRVMTRRFVKSFPSLSSGFEIETELTVHALEIGASILELPTHYKERPPGSASKLRSFRDGFRIIRLIARLVRDERPIEFFGLSALLLAITSFVLALPIALEYFETGLVPRQPTWVAAVTLLAVAFLSLACGLILEGVAKNRREARRLAYLALDPCSV